MELSEAKIGIVGYGAIGQEVTCQLQARGARIVVFKRNLSSGQTDVGSPEFHPIDKIKSLVKECDAISLHLAYVPGTPPILGWDEFAAIAEGGRSPVLVNTSRGGAVDESALLQALLDEAIRSAAIDVWSAEGDKTSDVVQALQRHPAVLATPHIASYTRKVTARTALAAAQNIVSLVEGRRDEIASSLVTHP
jgi:phosphoglycerate dehydrogenase-like enzyme